MRLGYRPWAKFGKKLEKFSRICPNLGLKAEGEYLRVEEGEISPHVNADHRLFGAAAHKAERKERLNGVTKW